MFCSVSVCCGAVYKSESNDVILIDIAKFKPCHRRHHGSLDHFTAVARDTEIINDNSSHAFVSASYSSSSSLSTQDNDRVDTANDLVYDRVAPDQDANFSSQFSSSVAAGCDQEDEDEYEDKEDLCSILQTDESMDAESPLRDTDDELDILPASAMADTRRSILCNLLWNNRPKDSENQSDFVWSESLDSWSSPHTMSKSSTVKVFP